VGNLISVPLQNNTNLNFGPEEGTTEHPQHPAGRSNRDQQRVEHHHAHDPAGDLHACAGPGDDRTNGIGDLQLSAFLSPATPGHWIWGTGAIVHMPTNSNADLGNKNWGLGPTFVSSDQLLDVIRAALRTKPGKASSKCHLATPNIG